eukprot:768070-Hanusia_phi.AAC.7
MLEVLSPTVSSRCKVLLTSWEAMPAIDVSEYQDVDVCEVLLILAAELTAKMLSDEPWMSILTDDVQGIFTRVKPVNELMSADKVSVSEDVCSPL